MKIADGSNREGGSEPFQAAIAIFPWCTKINKLDTPLLVLIGEKDDLCLPGRCVNLETSIHAQGSECEFVLKIYPDAYHGYDIEGMNKEVSGHHIEYNPEAANDTISRARDFLAKYLKAKH
jgi:dienelactone hydrolase